MRYSLTSVCLLLCGGLALFAHPDRTAPTAGPAVTEQQAAIFATQLAELAQFIAEQYIRDIPRETLLTAALKALYQAAGVPPPPSLAAEVRRAATRELQLQTYLARVRLRLGNPEPLQDARSIQIALEGMIPLLDPYCGVLTGPALTQTIRGDRPSAFGLELDDSAKQGPVVIKVVILGSPAQHAGLRPGDEVVRLARQKDDAWVVVEQDFRTVLAADDPLRLTVHAPGQKQTRSVTLTPENYRAETVLGVVRQEDESWDCLLDHQHKIGYIRITALENSTPVELAQALARLRTVEFRGLILDLRWCPGGYLEPSRDVADLFLTDLNPTLLFQPTPGNALTAAPWNLTRHSRNVHVWYRSEERDVHYRPTVGNLPYFPLVLLVNGDTTGGAELIAAVLQDNFRAVVLGQRTHGKASVQITRRLDGHDTSIPLTRTVPGLALKLSYGLLVRPSGKNLNRFADSKPSDDWGVLPTAGLEFRVSAELNQRLREWWQWQALRPAWDRNALRLDDPAIDPQLQAARERLLHLLR
jgi:carboxyl-terminal processing protease